MAVLLVLLLALIVVNIVKYRNIIRILKDSKECDKEQPETEIKK